MTVLTQMGSSIPQGLLLLQVWGLNILPFLRFYSDNLFPKLYKSDDRKWLLHPKSHLKISGKNPPTISEKFCRHERGQNDILKKGKKKKHYNNFNKTLHLIEIKKVLFVVSCSHWSALICKHIKYVFSFWRVYNLMKFKLFL